MSKDKVRKNDSLGSSAAKLHLDFKESHARYSDLISDLAMLTKSELRPIIGSLQGKTDVNGIREKINGVFDKISNVLIDMEEQHQEMDEIVQVIGGLEFSTNNTVDKLTEILRDQETQQARMTMDIKHIQDMFNKGIGSSGHIETILEDLEEFQLEFSRFQDYVQDSIPRINQLFDELDLEHERGLKYGRTHKI